MLLHAALCLLIATAQAEPGEQTSYGYPPPRRCGRQPCYPPNRCEYRGQDLSVCVLPYAPNCNAIYCGAGTECVLQEETCNYRPCNPRPVCIPKGTNPCGTCFAPSEFCELRPRSGSPPTCRFVVEPLCDNKICRYGKRCQEEPLVCIRAPCPIDLVCRRPYGYYPSKDE